MGNLLRCVCTLIGSSLPPWLTLSLSVGDVESISEAFLNSVLKRKTLLSSGREPLSRLSFTWGRFVSFK